MLNLANQEETLRLVHRLGWGHPVLTEQERGLLRDIEVAAVKLAKTTVLSFDQAARGLIVLADAGLAVDGAVVALAAGVPAEVLADAMRDQLRRV